MSGTCPKCGMPSDDRLALCSVCWGELPDEICERIITTFNEHGNQCDHFQCVVEGAVKYLLWKGDQQPPPLPPREKPQPPEWDPNKESDDEWWNK